MYLPYSKKNSFYFRGDWILFLVLVEQEHINGTKDEMITFTMGKSKAKIYPIQARMTWNLCDFYFVDFIFGSFCKNEIHQKSEKLFYF